MDVKQAIEQRRSVRKYKDIPVEEDKLKILLEAARLAPTGSNTQSGRFIVTQSKEMREKIAEVSHRQKWMTQAPLFISCIADIRVRIPDGALYIDELSPEFAVKQCIRDVSIQADHIVLQAEELGLSTCWIGWYDQTEIREALNLPSDKYVVCILVVGYANEKPAPRVRNSIEEIVRYEKW
ncbi:MAG: nitroreductase [Clostridia bacterium]|nr:nitroreductase [Clostridia bacterium]